jgi:hypothetical protein
VWQTDQPPVHLHWLSEFALSKIGASVGCNVDFVDFSDFNKWTLRFSGKSKTIENPAPIFSRNLELLEQTSRFKDWIMGQRLYPEFAFLMRRIGIIDRVSQKDQQKRTNSCVAVFSKM